MTSDAKFRRVEGVLVEGPGAATEANPIWALRRDNGEVVRFDVRGGYSPMGAAFYADEICLGDRVAVEVEGDPDDGDSAELAIRPDAGPFVGGPASRDEPACVEVYWLNPGDGEGALYYGDLTWVLAQLREAGVTRVAWLDLESGEPLYWLAVSTPGLGGGGVDDPAPTRGEVEAALANGDDELPPAPVVEPGTPPEAEREVMGFVFADRSVGGRAMVEAVEVGLWFEATGEGLRAAYPSAGPRPGAEDWRFVTLPDSTLTPTGREVADESPDLIEAAWAALGEAMPL